MLALGCTSPRHPASVITCQLNPKIKNSQMKNSKLTQSIFAFGMARSWKARAGPPNRLEKGLNAPAGPLLESTPVPAMYCGSGGGMQAAPVEFAEGDCCCCC